jgi:hypothetical protein
MTEQLLLEPSGRRRDDTASEHGTALGRARRFLSVVTVLFWRSLARTLVFSALTGLALASLGMALPTLRFYETSTYAHADFTYEIDHVLNAETEAALKAIATDGGYVSFTRFSNVEAEANARLQSRVELLLTQEPDKIGLSWFSDQLVVDQRPVRDEHWIDLSAHLAQALKVDPGDSVGLRLGNGVYRPVVRRIRRSDALYNGHGVRVDRNL